MAKKRKGDRKRNIFCRVHQLFLIALLICGVQVNAAETEEYPYLPLYAKSAVLMDGDSGRLLYGKNAQEIMPMASTTKIMTCIVALEQGKLDDWVTFSSYAASQPKVHLGAREGRSFLLKDLLYSLMLESHNDTAVAIAEHIGRQWMLEKEGEEKNIDSKQAVDAFLELMNEKAKELGCENTFFVTPNGLDGSREICLEDGTKTLKSHGTTAQELALVMRYCLYESPKKDLFLAITRQANHSFWDKEGMVCYSCTNHNTLLTMLSQAVSGKTGFTNAAGYCYVGAIEEGEKKFILALLACGWPNNKNYKWADCKELFAYGNKNYEYASFQPEVILHEISIKNGKASDGNPYSIKKLFPKPMEGEELEDKTFCMLVQKGEEVFARVNQQLNLSAPVEEDTIVGEVEYFLRDSFGKETSLERIPLYVKEKVGEIDFSFVLRYVVEQYLISG
ncbi:MAG: D-alanyl-D-alanine carboxypeptidase [Lachnospiraceae bacterium]|nr:D-alanyl-D-alanine carboxypeptidase [Lachnospiraceae bacterium]